MDNTSRNLELISRAYPGQALLSIPDAARVLGISHQKIKNDLLLGRFPVPTVKIGSRRLVPAIDLASYLDSLTTAPRRGPGRPRSTREGV